MSAPGWKWLAALLVCSSHALAIAQDNPPDAEPLPPPRAVDDKFPSADQVAEILKKEPITLETWPAWRVRLSDWIQDRGTATDPAFDAARKFIKSQAGDKDELSKELANDYLALYLLARASLLEIEGK